MIGGRVDRNAEEPSGEMVFERRSASARRAPETDESRNSRAPGATDGQNAAWKSGPRASKILRRGLPRFG